MEGTVVQAEPRYRALTTIAGVVRIIAWLALVLGGLGVVITAIAAGDNAGESFAILIGGAIYVAVIVISLFAYSELIKLMINLEENTRATVEALIRRP